MEHADAIMVLIKEAIESDLTFDYNDEVARDAAYHNLKSGPAKDHPLYVPLVALYDLNKKLYDSVKKKIAGRFKNKKGEVEADIEERVLLIRWQILQDKIKPYLHEGFDFSQLKRTGNYILPTVGNYTLVLQYLLEVRIAFDEFGGDPYFTKLPWEDRPSLELAGQKYYAVNEGNIARLQEYLNKDMFPTEVSFSQLPTAIIAVSLEHKINIYQAWMDEHKEVQYEDQMGELLEGITERNFNDEPYSNSWRRCWLIRYLKIRCDTLRDVKWALVVARKFIIAMVQRCYDPGCIMRLCMVLEGEQEIGKTKWIQSLAPCTELYVSVDLDDAKFGMNEFSRKVVRHSICEFEESGGISHKSDANRAKKAISMQVDYYHPKFRGHQTVRRSCLFVMSLNRMKDTLYDPTGATRFYPVHSTATRKDRMDIEGFGLAYPQILAQGIALYASGATSQLNDEEQDMQAAESIKLQYVPDDEEQEWVDEFFGAESNTHREDNTLFNNFEDRRDKGWVHWEMVVEYHRADRLWAERKDYTKHKKKINEGFKKWGFTIRKTTKHKGKVIKAYWFNTTGGADEPIDQE